MRCQKQIQLLLDEQIRQPMVLGGIALLPMAHGAFDLQFEMSINTDMVLRKKVENL